MIFLSIALISLSCFFISKKILFQRPLDILLVNFLFVCANIIVSFEAISLLGILNQPWALVVVQLVITVGAGILYFFSPTKENPSQISLIKTLQQFFLFCKQHKLFATLLAFITIAYLFLAYLSIIFPQNTSDSLYNHLARIAHWLQQGSLKPYDTFSYFGITYPYNNSLLMMWSVLFLHIDRLVGLVQWFGAIFLAFSIYGLATHLKFPQEQAGFSALIFLTFPIVALESTTAQNDILIATFFLIGLYLLIGAFQTSDPVKILFSALSFALAAGTKQYLVFAIPGILVILIYFLIAKANPLRFVLVRNFILLTFGFTFLFGSYAYIQNMVYFGNPIGPAGEGLTTSAQNDGGFANKLAFNSTRLGTQFISCEGLPVPYEKSCLEIKGNIFRKIFSDSSFNLESNQFMLEPDCGSTCFSFSTRYPLNEESAWFGILSWIIILPGCILAIIFSIRKKEPLSLLLIFTSLVYFLIISVFKSGWDAYVGRYLILSIAILMPFTGYLFSGKTNWLKWFTGLISILSIFILAYTILCNDSKPIISGQKMERIGLWGQSNHLLIVTKIAYNFSPWVENDISFFDYPFDHLRTFFANYMNPPVSLVDMYVPSDGSLGIIANNGFFLDYLFFGDQFTRKVYDLPDYSDLIKLESKIKNENIRYILVSPGIKVQLPDQFVQIGKTDNWTIYKLK